MTAMKDDPTGMQEGYASGMIISPQVIAAKWIEEVDAYLTEQGYEGEGITFEVSGSGVQIRLGEWWAEFPLTDLNLWTPEKVLSHLRQS